MIAAVLGATGKQGGAVTRHLVAAGLCRCRRGVQRPARAAQPPLPAGLRPAVETRWGRNVADAALAAGVPHLVYASLVAATSESGVTSFDGKWEVEQHIAAIGVPTTVLRPTTFMDGLHSPGMTRLTHLLHPEVRSHLIAGPTGVPYEQIQVDDPELRRVFGERAEPAVDIEALRALHPGLRTFAKFPAGVRNSTA